MRKSKQTKRGLALILAALLCTPAVPAYAEGTVLAENAAPTEEGLPAEEAGVGSGVLTGGENVSGRSVSGGEDGNTETGYVDGTNGTIQWSYDSETKTTVVTGSGVRTLSGTYPSSSLPAETEKVIFEECTIEGSLASFFNELNNLVSIDFTGLKMKNIVDMTLMFNECINLTELDLSGFETSGVWSMRAMFRRCEKLPNLSLSSFDTSSVLDMSWMFHGCYALAALDLSNFDTSSVLDMELMFQNCESLVSLDLSSFNTSNVKDMYSMFAWNRSLKSVNLSSFDTGNVSRMGYMFEGCIELTEIDLGNFNTSNVTGMEHMFLGCTKLTKLDLSGFDAGKVTDTTDMLAECANLDSINTPYNIVTAFKLPSVTGTVWSLSDGTEVTEFPLNQSSSVLVTRSNVSGAPEIITTTTDLNMDDVIRVKYVPYSYTVKTNNEYEWNKVTYSIVEGELAEGLQMYPDTGEIYGIPLEAGEFKVTVMATYSSPEFLPSYAELTLIVIENTDENVGVATDNGYEIIQPVENLYLSALPEDGSQVLVSIGEYPEFLDVYLDGRKLVKDKEYTSEEGSTRIIIRNQTLAGLGVGSHTLGIEFRTLGEEKILKRAAQNFVIADFQSPENEGDSNGGNNNNGGSDNNGSNNNNDGSDNNGGSDNNDSSDNNESSSGGDDSNGDIEDNNSGSDTENNNLTVNGSTGDVVENTDGNLGDQGENIQDTSGQTDIIYTIIPGDTLWKIAVKYFGRGELWRKIYNENKDIIQNPDRIYAGQKIKIRLDDTALDKTAVDNVKKGVYRVVSGDNLWKISQKIYGSGKHWERIYRANQKAISNPGRIYAGQEIIIPQ